VPVSETGSNEELTTVVGGGKMGEALLRGLVAAGRPAASLRVCERSEARAEELRHLLPGVVVRSEPTSADGYVLAVKPGDAERACFELVGAGCRPGPLLSIAAGVPTPALEGWLGPRWRVVRAMPNAAAVVGAAISAISPGASAKEPDEAWACRLLSALGEVESLPERLLDAVTGLSGSGPAYCFVVLEALIEGGIAAGIDARAAERLATWTMLGAARLAMQAGADLVSLRHGVTSPGGTTAAGLRELERLGVRHAFSEAVLAAARRSRELGSGAR